MPALKIAFVTTEERETRSRYELPHPWFGVAPSALLEGFKGCSEVEIHILTCVRRPVAMPKQIADNIFCHAVLVPRSGFLRTAYLPAVLALRRRLRQIKPDLVHGQGTERYAGLAAAFSGHRNVITLHGNMVELAQTSKARPGSFLWLSARLENVALRRTEGVFCNSRHTQSITAPRTSRTWLVPNAVREVFLRTATRLKVPPRCVLLNIGVISKNKQQLAVLEMARSLRQLNLDFELQFIGMIDPMTPYGDMFSKQAGLAESEGFARYLGQKSTEELVACFDSATALIHAPVSESFGLVVAEALARNLNFFGFRVGGVPDIVAGAEGAILVAPEDWSALRIEIASWLKSKHEKPQNADLMRSRYHPKTVANRHIEIYREILAG